MKYILKYIYKSKYVGYYKIYYKEFNSQFKIANFIIKNKIDDWKVYENFKCEFSDLLVNDNIEMRCNDVREKNI